MSEYALRLANSQDTAARVRAGDALARFPYDASGTVRARGGLRQASGTGVVSVVSGQMQVQVTPFSCWVDASPAGQLGYPFVCDTTKTLTIDPGDATLVRVDTVAVVVKENAYDGSGATSAVLTIVKGTPGAGAPAMPTSACIPLRNINVPAGASTGTGGLSSGALGADRRVWTVASGGVLQTVSSARPANPHPAMTVFEQDTARLQVHDGSIWRAVGPVTVATQAERDTLGLFEGLQVYRRDIDLVEVYDGTAWRRKLQAGQVSIATGGAASANVALTFPVAYASAPTVVATAEHGDYIAAVSGRTATGCTIYVTHRTGGLLSITVPVNWIAYGK